MERKYYIELLGIHEAKFTDKELKRAKSIHFLVWFEELTLCLTN